MAISFYLFLTQHYKYGKRKFSLAWHKNMPWRYMVVRHLEKSLTGHKTDSLEQVSKVFLTGSPSQTTYTTMPLPPSGRGRHHLQTASVVLTHEHSEHSQVPSHWLLTLPPGAELRAKKPSGELCVWVCWQCVKVPIVPMHPPGNQSQQNTAS